MLTPPDRYAIFASILAKELSRKVAAELLGLSLRHLRRLVKQYKSDGSSSLVNKKKVTSVESATAMSLKSRL